MRHVKRFDASSNSIKKKMKCEFSSIFAIVFFLGRNTVNFLQDGDNRDKEISRNLLLNFAYRLSISLVIAYDLAMASKEIKD